MHYSSRSACGIVRPNRRVFPGLFGRLLKVTGILAIELADTMPDGWQLWLDWHRLVAPDNASEINALEADRGNHLNYVRVVGRRQDQAKLLDPVVSLPAEYTEKPLLRSEQ